MMDDNSYYDQHILNLKKIRRAKDIFDDNSPNQIKANKDFKQKNYFIKEEKSNKEKLSDILNSYHEGVNNQNNQPSPIACLKKQNSEKNNKDTFNTEIFSEKLRKLISKKKK